MFHDGWALLWCIHYTVVAVAALLVWLSKAVSGQYRPAPLRPFKEVQHCRVKKTLLPRIPCIVYSPSLSLFFWYIDYRFITDLILASIRYLSFLRRTIDQKLQFVQRFGLTLFCYFLLFAQHFCYLFLAIIRIIEPHVLLLLCYNK